MLNASPTPEDGLPMEIPAPINVTEPGDQPEEVWLTRIEVNLLMMMFGA